MLQLNFVSYLSVEAGAHADPGAALAARRAAIAAHLSGCGGRLVAELCEIPDAPGQRTILDDALALCRQHGAVLLVAGPDQPVRDQAPLAALRRDLAHLGVLVAVASMPEGNAGTIGAPAAPGACAAPVADPDRVAPRRDVPVRLGERGALPDPVCRPRTMARALSVAPVLAEIRAAGATTFEQVAHALNELGVPSARGDRWYPAQVRRVEKRIASVA